MTEPTPRALRNPWWIPPFLGRVPVGIEERHLRVLGIVALALLFESYDILALPTAQVFPFDADVHWPKSIAGRAMDTYHRWMEVVIAGTLSGLPVAGLPAGFNDRGLPMGMQFIGRMGEDVALLEFAMAYEAATDHLDRRPELRDR